MEEGRASQARLLESVERIPGALSISYNAGELLFQVGAFAAGVYVVERGVVMQGLYRQGKPVPTSLYAPGDAVGIESWLDEPAPRYRGFARALTAVRVQFVSTQDWAQALASPEFRGLLLDYLARAWLNREVLHSLVSEPERALAWLLWRWGEPVSGRLVLPANTSLIAHLIGCSRNAAGKALEILVQEGAVEIANGSLVGFPQALRPYFEGALITSLQE